MTEPLFDRVDPTEMPDHLKGKSAQEVHDYWVNREKQIRAEAVAAGETPPTPPGTPPVSPTPPAPPTGMSAGVASTLINGAKLLASQGKEHWQRFLPEVEGIMSKMNADSQMNADVWTTVYEKVVGAHMSELMKEARESALRPPSMETSTPASAPSKPRELSGAELHVVDQLRRAGALAVRKDATGKSVSVPFDAEAYIAAEERSKTGVWPMTFNNY